MTQDPAGETGKFEFSETGRLMPEKSDKRFTFLKRNPLLWTWVKCLASDGEGCVALGRTKLSFARPAPLLRDQPVLPPSPVTTDAQRATAKLEKLSTAAASFQDWLTRPAPSLRSVLPQPTTAPQPAVTVPGAKAMPEKSIQPFDLQQVPETMDKIGLPVSAKMMRHWFSGASNYSATKEQVRTAVDHDGKPCSAEMIDHQIIKLDWVLSFPRAKKAYDELLKVGIFSATAQKELKACLTSYLVCRKDPYASFDAMTEAGRDVHVLHRLSQFQRGAVDGTWREKVGQWLGAELGSARVPDDLTGALGGFSFYAAVGELGINRAARMATIKSIYIYVRDSYSFLDENEDVSQYLGHWNARDVYVAPFPLQGEGQGVRWVSDALIGMGKNIFDKDVIMYPVLNKSFRDWRARHVQGGDFLVYTKPIRLSLMAYPMTVSL